MKMKYIDLCSGLPFLSAGAGLTSEQGQWSWPSCMLSHVRRNPCRVTPSVLLFQLCLEDTAVDNANRNANPKAPWPGPWTWMSPEVPFCSLTPPWECWRDSLLAAGDLISLSRARSSRFHINVSLAFSTCFSVMRLVLVEHSIARWTLISECSGRECSFSSFEDLLPYKKSAWFN